MLDFVTVLSTLAGFINGIEGVMKEIYEQALVIYNEGVKLERDNQPESAFHCFLDVYDKLKDIQQNKDADRDLIDAIAILTMQTLSQASMICETKDCKIYRNKDRPRANPTKAMLELYSKRPDINDLGFRLATAKSIVTLQHTKFLVKKEDRPSINDFINDHFEKDYRLAINILENISADEISLLNYRCDHLIYNLSVLHELIGHAYLYINNHTKGLVNILKAITYRARVDETTISFHNFLSSTYEHLEKHFKTDHYYELIFQFGRKVFSYKTNLNDTSFSDLESIFWLLTNNFSIANATKLSVLYQILRFIENRKEEGAFKENDLHKKFFPNNSFKREMILPYYQKRFSELMSTLAQYKTDFLILSSHPELIFAMKQEISQLRREVAELKVLAKPDKMSFSSTHIKANNGFFKKKKRPREQELNPDNRANKELGV